MIHCVLTEEDFSTQQLMKTWLSRGFPEITIDASFNDVNSAIKHLSNKNTDLVIVDISLNGGSGIDILKKIKNRGFEVICQTAYSDYAIEALNSGAIHYLLKPFSETQFRSAVVKAVRKINNKKKVLFISSAHAQFLNLDDIMFIHSDGPYSVFHFNDNTTIMSSKNLGYFEERLPEDTFIRIHHSYIVKIASIKKVEKKTNPVILLKDGCTIIPVSQRKTKLFYRIIGL